jgi:hypothetical protein
MARSSRRAAAAKNNRSIRLDFTGVGEGYFTPPADEYVVEIAKIEKGESSSGNDQLQIDFRIIEPKKFAGKMVRGWYSLVEQALWKLARELRSAGVELPEEAVDLDFDDIEGRKLVVVIDHREYNGDTKADIVDSWGIEEAGNEDEEEDEKPVAKGKKKPADEDDEEEAPKAKRGRKAKQPEPEDDEDEEEEPAPKGKRGRKAKDEDDEEDEKPARGQSKRSSEKSKKKLPKLSADEVSDMDEDDLESTIEKYGLDVDLAGAKTLRKKAALVIDALEAAGQLEDE